MAWIRIAQARTRLMQSLSLRSHPMRHFIPEPRPPVKRRLVRNHQPLWERPLGLLGPGER